MSKYYNDADKREVTEMNRFRDGWKTGTSFEDYFEDNKKNGMTFSNDSRGYYYDRENSDY